MEVQTHGRPPRSFYPDAATQPPPQHGAPGWDMGPERRIDDGRTMARGLAWFSFGLGMLEVFAAPQVARFLGVDDRHTNLIRAYGVREVASGAAILMERTPNAGVWSRVAGDALDLATLALAFRGDDPNSRRIGVAMLAVAGAAALDITCALQLEHTSSQANDRATRYAEGVH